jgi:hypothetical protein
MVPGWGHSRENHIYICLYRQKKIFFRAKRPISIKFGTDYPWVKGIINCSNKGSGPVQIGNNYKDENLGLGHLKGP